MNEYDRRYWEALTGWADTTEGSWSMDGVDYAVLSRWFLWDKIGRALRRDRDPDRFRFEEDLVGSPGFRQRLKVAWAPSLEAVLGRFREVRSVGAGLSPAIRGGRNGPKVFVPVPSQTLGAVAARLIRREHGRLIAPHSTVSGFSGVEIFRRRPPWSRGRRDFSRALHRGIIRGLAEMGVSLLSPDSKQLELQILRLVQNVGKARLELDELQPDVLLVHGDNHPPHQAYVLLAEARGVPTVMLQHGLDCEFRLLDEAFASHIAVWGPERAGRYERSSVRQPREIRVTGNPGYDSWVLDASPGSPGEDLVWVTRPHLPEKCYFPSRQPDEGLEILGALLEVLTLRPGLRLLIKPHPADYPASYLEAISRAGMDARTSLLTGSIEDALSKAKMVVTEDTSAGLDALLRGLPLVHAHLSKLAPTLPFVSYGAALPGFSQDEIVQSALVLLDSPTPTEGLSAEGGRAFVRDFAGPQDGQSADRVVDFLLEVAFGTSIPEESKPHG